MNILKLFSKLLNNCPICGCGKDDYSTKTSFCPCGCDLRPVTREASKAMIDDGLSGGDKLGFEKMEQ